MSTWTAPQTWSAVVVTVPDLDREIRDNLNALHWAVLSKTADYTVAASDGDSVLVKVDATSGAKTITLPTAVGRTGARVGAVKTDTSVNVVTVDGNGSQTISGALTWVLASQWDAVSLISDGANWVIVASVRTPHIVVRTTTYTALVTDDIIEATSGTFTITLHSPSAVRPNRQLIISNQGSGVVTVASADTIVGVTSIPLARYTSLILLPNNAGTAWMIT